MWARSVMGLVVAAMAAGAWLLAPAPATAQERGLLVLILDPGTARLNADRLGRSIERATHRRVIRMTDERAPMAEGRLSIAFSRPNRWVLRYESNGQVAWVSDRIEHAGQLRSRLSQLALSVVSVIERPPSAASAPPVAQGHPRDRSPDRSPRRSSGWDDVILALQDEIVDPFADDQPRSGRPVTVLWSEVIDPFADARRSGREVWTEVLDPWEGEVRRRR